MRSANETVFENLIIRDCNRTALLVADEAEETSPFEPDTVPTDTRRLDITIRNVDFVGNVAGDDEILAGAFVAGEKVHAELIGCLFERNVGITGGAVKFSGDSLLVEECIFVRNNASSSGGAIFANRDPEARARKQATSVTAALPPHLGGRS